MSFVAAVGQDVAAAVVDVAAVAVLVPANANEWNDEGEYDATVAEAR